MLQDIRDNAQGTIAKIIVGLIVITFALFGVESIVGSLSGEPEVANVNGESVTEYEFQRQLERKRRQVINQMGERYDPSLIDENLLRSATLNDIIANEVQHQAAADKGLVVADEAIDRFILSWPPAQVEGRFDRDQFQSVLRNIGLSALDFRIELKKEMLLNQVRSAITQTAFVLDAELAELLRLERQKRSFKYLELSADRMAKDIEVNAVDVSDYYDKHQTEFELPERVRLDYIEINKAELADRITLDEEDVRARYEAELVEFTAEEQRRASHILLEVGDDVAREDILAKARDIKARIEAGEPFAELAETESDDIGSAQKGGDLGFVNRGTLGKEFDEVLFSLEEGEVSEPVRTDYGYHIIKLDEVFSADPPEFEESEARIRTALKQEKAEDLFIETSAEVADLTYSAPDLNGPADELGVRLRTSDPFPRTGGEGLFSNPAVLNQAFSEDVLEGGHNSEVVEVNRDTILVFRKNEYLPKQVQSLATVEKTITEKLALEIAKKKLKDSVAELVEKAERGQFDEFEGQGWEEAEKAGRNQREFGIAIRNAFEMPKPVSGISVSKFETGNGYMIVALTEVIDGEVEKLSEVEMKSFKTLLSNWVGSQEYNKFNDALESLADIERL